MATKKNKAEEFLYRLLLDESDTFCMIPWVSIHTTPTGQAAPCCISRSCSDNVGVGNSNKDSLAEIVNSDKMKQLRLDMLKGTKNPECANCHKHDEQGVPSFRTQSNKVWKKDFVDVLDNTDLRTGAIKNFKMKYFDIRFSNICNFKCRTCGPAFSTLWEQEDLKSKEQCGFPLYAEKLPKGNRKEFVKEVLDCVPDMEIAYFAGGEPLITDEMYLMLDEMIRVGKTDIELRYNTNISNMKYKKRDIFKLWQHFEKPIQIYASIDHYGPKAEYIRHGTEWSVVEANLKKLIKAKNVVFQVNTVLSVFNALTISHFYKYMIDNHFYTPNSPVWTLYNMGSPEHVAVHILPEDYKAQVVQQLELTIQYMKDLKFRADQIQQIEQAIGWVTSKHTWDEQKQLFKEERHRIDTIREEDFTETFPELAMLYKIPASMRP